MYRSPFKAKSTQTTSFKKKGSWAAGYHTGIDRVCSNTALVSPADGTVQRNEYNISYGNMVIITTNDGKSILMAHMKEKSKLKVGASIKKGDAVGTMGNTGNSFGAHLHIEVQNSKTWAYNKNLLNPNSYIDWNDTTSKTTASAIASKPATSPFKVGDTVTLTTNVNVRTGAGTSYAQKTVSQLTADGKKNATSTKGSNKAVLKASTKVTIQAIKLVGSDIWAQIPSGWICLRYNGKNYVK
ncbi:MAG: M23 family metallopeptidase [Eubacterium sp.]|nr:M23 family metallopeptidase [Eubacterium sp.]